MSLPVVVVALGWLRGALQREGAGGSNSRQKRKMARRVWRRDTIADRGPDQLVETGHPLALDSGPSEDREASGLAPVWF